MPEFSFSFLNVGMPVLERHFDMNLVVITISAFVVMILLLLVKLLFKSYFQNLFINVFRYDVSASQLVESNSAGIQASVLTSLASIISIGNALMCVAIYYNASVFSKTINSVLLLSILIGSVAAFLFFYKIVLGLLGWILEISEIAKSYSDMISDIFKVLGIILFPIFLLLPFADLWMQKFLIFSIIASISIALLVKIFGFFKIMTKIKFFNHYAILYFCTFEILPILLIVKIAGYF